jgi:thiosulfate/3-mercaptopyruvate sulfurtransferase
MTTILFLFQMIFLPTFAEPTDSVEIISAEELKTQIDQFFIIDARESGFVDGHLPKSQPMHWQEWTEEKPSVLNNFFGEPAKWGKLWTGPDLQARLQKFGLKKNQKILVVGQPNAWGEEGRIAWNLLFWGVQKVALLDGGYPAWQKLGLSIEKGNPRAPPIGDFIVSLTPSRRAQMDDISQNLKSHTHDLFDARTNEEFAGKKMSGQKRGGKIPGAKLVLFSELYSSDGSFISKERLKKFVGENPKSPITYCTGWVRSALLAMLIEARLGVKAMSYDGSLWEWSREPKLPLD